MKASTALLLYAAAGAVVAARVAPLSFPFGRNALLVTALWPAYLAAGAQQAATGKLPQWAARTIAF